METRRLGDMKVSLTGLGLALFGRDGDYPKAERLIHAALDNGINFFDTADIYGNVKPGVFHSEEFLGRALGNRRSRAHISTKFGYSTDPADVKYPTWKSASPAYIEQAVNRSLKILRTDYIDLYQPHTFDPVVPIEDTLGGLARLIQKGKIRHIGSSRFNRDQIVAADAAARKAKSPRFVSTQAALNLLQRRTLTELVPTLEKLDIALIPFSPLASGFLTGQYRANRPLPEGTPLTQSAPTLGGRVLNERNFKIIDALDEFAMSKGHTVLQLAFAWLAAQPTIVSVIAGADKPEHVIENARATLWKLTKAEVTEVNTIVASFDASERTEGPR